MRYLNTGSAPILVGGVFIPAGEEREVQGQWGSATLVPVTGDQPKQEEPEVRNVRKRRPSSTVEGDS